VKGGGQQHLRLHGGVRRRISGVANHINDSLVVAAQQTIPISVGLERRVIYEVVKPKRAVLLRRYPAIACLMNA